MKFQNPYLIVREKIELLQRWIVVHSIIYYELDSNIVDDRTYDANCKQLVALQEAHRDAFEASQYYYAFHDFDGSTGFDLCNRLGKAERKYLRGIAKYVLSLGGKKLNVKIKV